MNLIEPTFRRSLSIWWAASWRGMVFYLPFTVVMVGFIFAAMPEMGPDGTMNPEAAQRMAVVFPVLWLVMFGGIIVSGAFGMQWMLRTQRWKDYFVALIPAKDPRADAISED